MFRVIFWLIAAVLIITVLRMVIGVVLRGAASVVRGSGTERADRQPDVPRGGDLKKDPVCGTYVSAQASISTLENGERIYFCSTGCRDKYRARVS